MQRELDSCTRSSIYDGCIQVTRNLFRYKLRLVAVAAAVFLYLLHARVSPYMDTRMKSAIISEDCICMYKNQSYNLCYHMPHNMDVKGLRFNCDHVPYLEKLGLLSTVNAIDLSLQEIPRPAFVSALTQNSSKEGLTMLVNFRAVYQHQKIIIYDLGLDPATRNDFENMCLVEMRTFPYDQYPSNVKILEEHRWKAILIALAVQEFGAVWYMEPSIIWKKDRRAHIYSEFDGRKRKGVELPRFVLCSLEKKCIAPSGAKSSCEFGTDRYNEYAKCHRFDQSVVNLLLANAYRCNASNYRSHSLENGARLLSREDLIPNKVKLECSHKW